MRRSSGGSAIIGGAVGAIATLAATSAFEVDPAVGFWALFAYFALFGITAGIVLGCVVAIILDAVSRRRVRTVVVEREQVGDPDSQELS